MESVGKPIFDILTGGNARLNANTWLEGELGVAQWTNAWGNAKYHRPGHHTLSFYLRGGQSTSRRFAGGRQLFGGAPDKLCLMPSNHESEWLFEDEFNFFHLYFNQQHLNNIAVKVLDIEPAHIELQDKTFVEDPFVENVCRNMILPLDWQENADKLGLGYAGQMLILHLFRQYTNVSQTIVPPRGGLAAHHVKLLQEYIYAHLESSLSLAKMAELVGLSEYHFCRMFAVSFKQTPHQYVLTQRIKLAQSLLDEGKLPQAHIALQTGFSSQSHFSRSFKKQLGVTPRQYVSSLR